MFRNKLIALEHPFAETADSSFKNDQDFASTVLWLEDQKIRHYRIEDRDALRNIDNYPEWNKAFEKYKNDIGVPTFETRIEDLDWILSYAVRLEYMDRADDFKDITGALVTEAKKPADPMAVSKNPFDSMDMNCEDFEQGVRRLGRMLNIAHHPDHLKVLEAASRIIERKLGKSAEQNTGDSDKKTVAYSLKDSGKFIYNDTDLDEAAKILRLLQVHSTRNLQTTINETIVNVQDLTANPKTDTKLGKVGF
ncbi:RNA transcription, translation and transport factor protein [Sitodiplosis mosellana]|uniref:RNA transcription, translation and transport factor protein n=1 Tax=Sitodiplosis mosellana TaxID=263140 RepID=UPI002444E33D|nr:RNA transcription, translation and transport factor protein [Sitodiplosis mosellana]